MSELTLIKKDVLIEEGQPWTEPRWFVETGDGFDGTAQGYGYKSPQALHKAYAYFKNRKHPKKASGVKEFLRDNADVKTICDLYFDVDEMFHRMKAGETISIENLVSSIAGNVLVIEKLNNVKHLWKQLVKEYTK